MGRRATRFDLAYEAVRQRLLAPRNPSDPLLSIQDIASSLNLSMTPVREAMSRLYGEGVLIRIGASYAWPAFDRQDTCDLLDLHLVVILAALDHDRPGADHGPAGTALPPPGLTEDAAEPARSPWAECGLFASLVAQSQRPVLVSNQARLAQQLAPLLAGARLAGPWRDQAHQALWKAGQARDLPRLVQAISTYHALLKHQLG